MRRRHTLKPDTFPFLAVLLCAMGSLILILLEMDRRARSQAHARARQSWQEQQRDQAERASLLALLHDASQDDLKRQHDEQRAARDAEKGQLLTQQQLSRREEEQVRRKIDELLRSMREEETRQAMHKQTLHQQAEALQTRQRAVTTEEKQLDAARRALQGSQQARDRMARELALLEEALKQLRERRARNSRTVSVVPYVGKRGENRKPLYVECAAERIVFHPDKQIVSGFEIAPQQLRDVIARRLRELLAKDETQAPYFLLLVRPGGIVPYYAFLEALRPLEVAYGYEFIDDGFDLDFPDPATLPEPVDVVKPLPSPAPRKRPASVQEVKGSKKGESPSGWQKFSTQRGLASDLPFASDPADGGPVGGNAKVQSSNPFASLTKRAIPAPPAAGGESRKDEQPPDNKPPAEKTDNPSEKKTAGATAGESSRSNTGANGLPGPIEPPPIKAAARPGKREYMIFVDCLPEGVRISPLRQDFSRASLEKEHGTAFVSAVRDLIDRRLQLEPEAKIVVRFAVHKDGLRVYHLAYPLLNGLDVEKRAIMSDE